MAERVIVAIDGPSGAGKSTIARSVAARLGFVYIDTGAMYRAVALWAATAGIAATEIHKLERLAEEADIRFEAGSRRVFLNGGDITEAIRAPEISAAASKVAAIPGVRRALVAKQQQMGSETSIVMEGRDIGSVVFPDATVKIYLDAPAGIRAERRTKELCEKGAAASISDIAEAMKERDQRDRRRAEAPLVQAPDAVYVDTGGLTVEEAEEAVLRLIRERTANGKEYSR